MDYNTQRPKLKLPEYGRHIQKMVDHLKTIKDADLRNNMAKALIDVMGNMNPHLRDVPDFKHKLWDHLAIMSDFDLDIEWPYPLPEKKTMEQRPDKVPYSDGKIKFKHYGRNLQEMLEKVNEFEGETRDMLIEQLANHMKTSYVSWKKETVNDNYIFQDINKISNVEIVVPEGLTLKDVKQPQAQQSHQQKKGSFQKKSNKFSQQRKRK